MDEALDPVSTTTSIEWTDVTWNPVRGCSLVSAGCANCYAMKQAHRFSGVGKPYEGLTEPGPQGPRWTGKIRLVPEALEEPLHWKTPRRVFVNSMSDLFHEDVPFDFIHWVFSTIRQTPQHTYQILTKRPSRMLEVMNLIRSKELFGWAKGFYSHVWLGVSVEDQATADERIPILLQTPAAVRFVSAEPLLGPVSFRWAKWDDWKHPNGGPRQSVNQYDGLRMLDWVIIGGESGSGARTCDMAWIRSIKDQCEAAKVPVFVKQLGANIAPVVIESGSVKERLFLKDRKGGDIAEWPDDLRVRQFPKTERIG